MAASQFGRPDAFLSEEELLRFRTLTGILALTNNIDDSSSGQTNIISTEDPKGQLYRKLAEFTDLLVRHNEVVAVLPSDRKGGLLRAIEMSHDENNESDDEREDEREEEEEEDGTGPAVMFGGNPRDEDKGKTRSSNPRRVTLHTEITMANPLPIEDYVGHWLIERTTGRLKIRGFPQTDVSFSEHGATIVDLARKTYLTSTDEEWKKAYLKFSGYVLTASCAKINGRIARGDTTKRKFLGYLKRTGAQLSEEVPASSSIPLEPVSGHLFSTKQTYIIKQIIQHLKWMDISLGDLSDWDKALEREKPIHYDKEGRLVFQTLLALTMTALVDAARELSSEKRSAQLYKCEHLSEWEEDPRSETFALFAEKLNWRASTLSLWMGLFVSLKSALRALIKDHLAFLQKAYIIKGFVKRSAEHPPSETSFPRPQFAASTSFYHDLEPSSDPTEDLTEELIEGVAHTDLDKENYVGEWEGIDANVTQNEWGKAALAYMDLISLHQVAITGLSRRRRPTSADDVKKVFLQKSRFEHIRCYQDDKDREWIPIENLLMDFEVRSGERLTTRQIALVTDWIRYHNFGKVKAGTLRKTSSFSGTFHCETIIISLHLLAKNREDLVQNSADTTSAAGPELPSKPVTDRFLPAIEILPVSKRCCPACDALVAYLEFNQEELIRYPGSHSTWTAAALPPWIPKQAGLDVIEAANSKFRQRVRKIIETQQRREAAMAEGKLRKSSSPASSTGTSPAHDLDDEEPQFVDRVAPIPALKHARDASGDYSKKKAKPDENS
ncbi:hypothetical protein K505DRAFT_320840 [Melanomma pulvis-pyrius CBS 109.77]|uniref:Uncharacterized protein n=1 Tax=Melanomma pulvis-pyrius CBS 109.77 TaxID=1314802 RepID=A0A6A6XV25_9PLEO|nr:hypothetical protein K505DRAFT_320840 [Melanomma pulvis-pyrius CBS 109.77]